ncbi:hypothetical protein WICPIJ_007367, partial [Wickerhamomyces pijperi]
MLASLETSSSLQHHFGPTRLSASSYIKASNLPSSHANPTAKKSNSTLLLDDQQSTLSPTHNSSSSSTATISSNGQVVSSEIHIGGRKSQLAVAQS